MIRPMTAPDDPAAPRDETTLVCSAQAGDTAAFEALLRASQGRAWRVALRMLGNPADAQDAVQEAFVSAWRALGRFQPGASFGAWLVGIVTHRCLNVLRSRKRARIDDDASLERADPSGDPERAWARREDAEMLDTAMRRLPPGALAVMVLHYTEEMPCARIGEVLGMSESAVKVALFRARGRLREMLGGDGHAV